MTFFGKPKASWWVIYFVEKLSIHRSKPDGVGVISGIVHY